ncbi:uncharacterized protein LOC106469018 [Limulus polyphemus]|uniref:Uncharacterized protein LOC106469018 n=1 Tax=Limulus polyphemus TaxID=6850 RepID=A0ABM1TB67_LIMPO|nr:uncharacterized protein LOC106469018 [Limulus polyphemus]XP_022253123.1 uncharacterized protein LOC106469018 [Limulus polyphemus]
MASTTRVNSRPLEKDSDIQCNTQLCTSYVLGILACVMIIGGVCLAFYRWDYMWLVVSAIGGILVLLGSLLHFCGSSTNQKNQRQPTRKHSQIPTDQSIPSAPTLRDACSTSQLSLTMTHSYFSEDSSLPTPTAPVSNIDINGQKYVLLSVGGEYSAADTRSIITRLSSIFSNSTLEFVSGTTEQSITQNDYRSYQIEDNVYSNEPKPQSNRHSFLQILNGTITLQPQEEQDIRQEARVINTVQSGTETCCQLQKHVNNENIQTVLISNEELLIENGETLEEQVVEAVNTQISTSETLVLEEQQDERNSGQEYLYDFPRQLITPVEPEDVVITNCNARSTGEHVGNIGVNEPILSTSVHQNSDDPVHEQNIKSVNYKNPFENTPLLTIPPSDVTSPDSRFIPELVSVSPSNCIQLRQSQPETSCASFSEEFHREENQVGHLPEIPEMCNQEINGQFVHNLEVQSPRESHDIGSSEDIQSSDLLNPPPIETILFSNIEDDDLEERASPPPSYEEVARDKHITESAYCLAFGTL